MAAKKALYMLAFLALITQGCRTSETIVEGLSQNDANIVIVALRDYDIKAKKEAIQNRKGASYNILVEKNQAKEALQILVHQQLPKVHRPGLREVYPPGSSQLIPTKSDEQARLIMAQEGELEALLKVIPNVIDARVALAMDQSLENSRNISPKSAAVALIYQTKDDEEKAPISHEEIARLVAHAVGSIDQSQVMVVSKALKPLLKTEPNLVVESGNSKKLLWSLLGLVILALLIAAYAFFRTEIAAFLARRPGTT